MRFRGKSSSLRWAAALLLAVMGALAGECFGQAASNPKTDLSRTPAVGSHKAAAKAPTATRRKQPKKSVEPPPPSPPPMTLANMPPGRPRVLYRNGELSIASDNSTLSEILNAVHTQTGASIDMPSGGGSERVVARLGPGPADQVLAKLLNGSHFDYVIMGEDGQPGAVKTVLLRPKQGGGENSSAPSEVAGQTSFGAQRPQVNAGMPPNGSASAGDDEAGQQPDTSADEGVEAPDDANIQQQPPPAEAQPEPEQQNGNQPNGNQPNQGVKTPEQLLQELQRMQQMQQQQQQQPQQQPQYPQQPPDQPPPGSQPQDVPQ